MVVFFTVRVEFGQVFSWSPRVCWTSQWILSFLSRTLEGLGRHDHGHSGHGSGLAVSISKAVTTMSRHFDQDEGQTDGSRHWDSLRSVLVKKVCICCSARLQ